MKVSDRNKAFVAAHIVLGLLLFAGVSGLVVIVPALAAELVGRYSEYESDFIILIALLGLPLLIGLATLGLILVLLRRIRLDRLLAPASYGPIRWLVLASALLAGSFVLIGVWLAMKNTLPPVIAIVLAVFALVSLAVSLVTNVLFGLLKQAVAHSDELREVI